MYKIGENEYELTSYNLANADKCFDFVDMISRIFYENGELGKAIMQNTDGVLRFLSAVLTPKGKKWTLDIYQQNYEYFKSVEIPMSIILRVVIDFFTNNIELMQSLRFPTMTQKMIEQMIEQSLKDLKNKS